MFESGAILLYLAEKTGRFLPRDARERLAVLQWLFWQIGGFGPMLGQSHHFNRCAPEPIEYAMDRYRKEATRLYNVLDKRLTGREYVAGDYTIADMAIFPWCREYKSQRQDIENFPHVKRWFERVAARPAVARDMDRFEDQAGAFDEHSWSNLFGANQFKRR